MKYLKGATIALTILFISAFVGGMIADWTSGAPPGSVDLLESVLGALAIAVATLLIMGTPLTFVAKRLGLNNNPFQLAFCGFLGGALSMAIAIVLVDGLPFYVPYDLVLVLSLGIGGAIGLLYWAKSTMQSVTASV